MIAFVCAEDSPLGIGEIERESLTAHVCENGLRAGERNRVGGGNEREVGNDDFVSGPDSQSLQCDCQRHGRIVHNQRVRNA